MNLSTSGMLSNFKQDIVVRQLSRSASSNGKIYDPTSSAQKSNHETDKQAEENATWFFEYKALLNSKLTTLTTALTSAYTTDLDASMTGTGALAGPNSPTNNFWGNKNAMQGRTGVQIDLYPDPLNQKETTLIDPGAGRTTDVYFRSFGYNTINLIAPPPVPPNTLADEIYGTDTIVADSVSFQMNMNSTGGNLTNYTTGAVIGASANINNSVQGTTTFLSGGSTTTAPLILDKLYIDLADNKNNNYFNTKRYEPQYLPSPPNPPNTLNPNYQFNQTVTPYPSSIEQNKNIGNNLELTLYKFFSKPENYDLIRFGLMDELYIVGTSSLATGSQIQGSISLRYNSANVAGNGINNSYIEVKQERYSCFFHS